MRKIYLMGIILFLFYNSILMADNPITLKVTTAVANIRSKPDKTAKIIQKVTSGTLLEAQKKVDDWYKLELTIEGKKTDGYINEIVVQRIENKNDSEESESTEATDESEDMPQLKSQKSTTTYIGVGCLLLGGAAGYLAYDTKNKADDLYDDYKALFNNQQYEDASAKFQDVKDKDKLNTIFLISAGVATGIGVVMLILPKHSSSKTAFHQSKPENFSITTNFYNTIRIQYRF